MRKLVAAIAAALSFGAAGCAEEDQKTGGQSLAAGAEQMGESTMKPLAREVSVTDLPPIVASGDVTLIDVRRPNEWAETGMAEGAIGATLQDADFIDQVRAALGGDTSKPVALICRSGGRSATAQKKLEAAGFSQVTNVTGGTLDWIENDLPMTEYVAD